MITEGQINHNLNYTLCGSARVFPPHSSVGVPYFDVELRFGEHTEKRHKPKTKQEREREAQREPCDWAFSILLENDCKYEPNMNRVYVDAWTGHVVCNLENQLVLFTPHARQYERWEMIEDGTMHEGVKKQVAAYRANLLKKIGNSN